MPGSGTGGCHGLYASQFCADHHALLTSGQPLAQALPQIAEKLSTLLSNPQFVADSFSDDTPLGKRTLHHDADTDVYVLAHVYEGPKKGSPHSHGASWAVYGNARAVTEMTEWRRTNPESEEQAVLEPVANYSLGPGDTRAYGPGVLHSTRHPGEGLGDPRHRHRSRRHPALPLPAEDRQDRREGVSRQEANMRPWQRRLLLSLVTVAMSWPAAAPASAEPIVLKVGISEPVNTVLAIWMADAAGFYEANGIKVEIVNMNGGSRGAAELAAGRIDAMHVGLSSVVRLNRSGGDLRIVASLANVIRFTFFSGPGVKTAADLKGGVVGVSSFGSESDSTVTLALKRLGLTREDVTLKEYGGGTKRLAAVKSGEIKATAVNEPFSSMAREQGFNVLFDLVPEQIPWLFTAIVVRRGTIADRARRADAVHPRDRRGQLSRAHRREEGQGGAGQAGRHHRPENPRHQLQRFQAALAAQHRAERGGGKNILAQFPDVSQKAEDYIDTGILDTLRKDGVFTALAQKYQRLEGMTHGAEVPRRTGLGGRGGDGVVDLSHVGRPGDPARPRDLAGRSARLCRCRRTAR